MHVVACVSAETESGAYFSGIHRHARHTSGMNIRSGTKSDSTTSGILQTSIHFYVYKKIYCAYSCVFVPFESNINKALFIIFLI